MTALRFTAIALVATALALSCWTAAKDLTVLTGCRFLDLTTDGDGQPYRAYLCDRGFLLAAPLLGSSAGETSSDETRLWNPTELDELVSSAKPCPPTPSSPPR